MSPCGQHCLAVVFVLLGSTSALALVLMVGGCLRVDGEWPGLLAGAVLLGAMILALRR